jgi:two-component system NtrC family response regulator
LTAESKSVLLVDDDESLRRVLEYQLGEAGYAVTCAATADGALDALASRPFHLLVTDILMPGIDGIALVERARILYPDVAVIVITAHGDVGRAVRAMQLGALDFLEKPFGRERLLVSVERALRFVDLRDENRRLRAVVQGHESFDPIVGRSPALEAMLADLSLAADSDATVLILGESGTGKELAARALHLRSRRRDAAFVVVNCGAIPESLIESELFGHRRGAFTGAIADHVGRFERASGGTLFLDEVGELPRALQPKLLRVLQEGEVDKLGAGRPLDVDVRVVAASHGDLEARVREGTFREDLWYRLNVVPLRIPPLRERLEDIPVLTEHFLLRHAERYGRPVPRLAPEIFDRLQHHDWPGNVRELENLLERLVVLNRTEEIALDDLPAAFREELPRYGGARVELPPGGIVLDELERSLIQEALGRCSNNRSAAARFLGISRQTLLYRMRKFGLR